MPLTVTVVGAGRVGLALGRNLLGLGHTVRYAVRSSREHALPEGAVGVPVSGASEGVDLTILAVPLSAVIEMAHALRLAPGAILVDATNPFGQPLPDGFRSGAHLVDDLVGDRARVVKAFNVLGAEHMASPPLPDGRRPVLPVAGDDEAARAFVADLAVEMGFDAVEVGGLENASILEEVARYWGLLAFTGGRGRGVVLVAEQRP
jgi:8-hydroxy-5-deazaflavin:NADPH oxidoreductase